MRTKNTFLHNVYFNIVHGHWTELGTKHMSQRKRASSPIIFCDDERSFYTHVSDTYWYRFTVAGLQLCPFGSSFVSGQLLSNTLSINQSRHSTFQAQRQQDHAISAGNKCDENHLHRSQYNQLSADPWYGHQKHTTFFSIHIKTLRLIPNIAQKINSEQVASSV